MRIQMVMWSVHTKTFVFHPSLLKLNSKETEAPASKGAYFFFKLFLYLWNCYIYPESKQENKNKNKRKKRKGFNNILEVSSSLSYYSKNMYNRSKI